MATTIQTIELPKKARALDTSGNNNHGQIYSGRALEFDGVADNLRLDGFTLEGTKATVAFWINTATTTGYAIDLNSTIRFIVGFSSNKFKFYDGNGWKNMFDTIATDVYLRCVVVLDGTVAKGFLNGHQLGTDLTIQNISIASNTTAAIGSDNSSGGSFITAKLSDFQIWDAAFTQADVTYDYLNPESLALNNGGTALTESNLKLWYPMQDGHRGQQSYILDGSNSGLGVEEVTNGDFATGDLTGWTAAAKWTYSDGKVRLQSSDGDGSGFSQSNVFVVGNIYKITFDVVVTSGTAKLEGSGGSIASLIDTTKSYVFYWIADRTDLYFNRVSATSDLTIDNVSVQVINDKNHATTVFYGDELVTNGDMEIDGNWADYNSVSSNTRSSTQEHGGSYSRKFTPDGTSQGIKGDTFTTVTGRTYAVDFWVYPDDGAIVRWAVRKGDDDDWADDTAVTGLTENAWNNVTGTYTESAGGDGAYIIFHSNSQTEGDFYIDDVSIKEVGVASGWTDADQQLHIPQTALQSYNELAWFDGVDDTLTVTSFDFTTGQTINLWVNPANLESYRSLFGLGTIENYMRYKAGSETEMFQFEPDNNTAYDIDCGAAGVIQKDKWTMCTFIWNTDRTMDAYFNSKLVGSSSATEDSTDGKTMKITKFGAGYDAFPFNGAMTEISHYSDILTQAEVNDLYNDGKAKSALEADGSGGLTGYWRNNGLSTWTDLKGSNDGTVTCDETILIPQGVDSSRDNQGFIMNRQKDTSCLNLTNEAYVDSPTGGFVGTSDFSIECWFKTTDSNAWLLMKGEQGSGGKRYALYVHTSNYLTAAIDDNSTNVTWNGSATVNDGDWHHAVVTFDRSGNGQIYLDGSTDGSATSISSSTGSLDPTNHRDFTVGVNSNDEVSGPYTGQVDGVLIYTKVLSLAEVERNYNATKGSHRN